MRRAAMVLIGFVALAAVTVASPTAGADVVAATPPPDTHQVQPFGSAERFDVPTREQVLEPVDLTADPSSEGYWRTDSLGRVEASGGAAHAGSTFGLTLAEPVVAMAATPSGEGYWLAATDGGVFAFGDAGFFGSMGGIPLVAPIVEIVATSTGAGYWLIAGDGGVFAFGDAGFFGSMGGIPLVAPIVAGGATPSGQGYWLAAADGGVFAFGDAGFFGSMGGISLVSPVMGFAPTIDGSGYWMAAQDGGVFAFGSAPFLGSDTSRPSGPRTAFAASDTGPGYWMSSTSVFGPVGLYDTARPVVVIDPDPSQPALLLAAGTTVQTTGALADLGGGAWVEIDAPDSPRRFIRYDDLVPTPGIAPDVAAVPCDGGDEPASFPTPTAEPPPASGGGAQTYVFGVDHQVLADGCERVTVVFGADGLDGRAPIGEIPGGVSFTARGSNGSVYLPFVELQDPVVTLQTGRAGDRAALFTVVRLAEPAGSGEQAAVIHSNAVRRMEATFMENPARVVIDLGEESSAPGGDLAPAIGPERSPTEPGEPFAVITQLQGSGDDLAFRGLARTFEAVADIRLRTAGMVPGGGTPVTATFTGVIGGTVTDDSVAVSLTDYVLAWGEFEIGIEGLAAGTYELFVGEPDMETGLDEGAYLTFEVE